ncbi:MAG: hypothetical protein RI573_10615 [Balneolaceae bacterium]|nr:hypothetical protein [Balneolaceae bacterium]
MSLLIQRRRGKLRAGNMDEAEIPQPALLMPLYQNTAITNRDYGNFLFLNINPGVAPINAVLPLTGPTI